MEPFLIRAKLAPGANTLGPAVRTWAAIRDQIESAGGTPLECGPYAIAGDSHDDLFVLAEFPNNAAAVQVGVWFAAQGYGTVTTNPLVPIDELSKMAERAQGTRTAARN